MALSTSLKHSTLCEESSYGMSSWLSKFVNILHQLHDGMTAQVTIGGQESKPFLVHTGVRQGCMLAPVLFIKLLHNEI